MKLPMCLLIISCVINSFACANLYAQSNVFRIPGSDQYLILSNGIPVELRGKYVLVARGDSKTYKLEDLKKPEPYCEIHSNKIVRANGKVLRVSSIARCIDKEMAGVMVRFGGKEIDTLWILRDRPPYTVLSEVEGPSLDSPRRIEGQSSYARAVRGAGSLDTNLAVMVTEHDPIPPEIEYKNFRVKLLKIAELPSPSSP